MLNDDDSEPADIMYVGGFMIYEQQVVNSLFVSKSFNVKLH